MTDEEPSEPADLFGALLLTVQLPWRPGGVEQAAARVPGWWAVGVGGCAWAIVVGNVLGVLLLHVDVQETKVELAQFLRYAIPLCLLSGFGVLALGFVLLALAWAHGDRAKGRAFRSELVHASIALSACVFVAPFVLWAAAHLVRMVWFGAVWPMPVFPTRAVPFVHAALWLGSWWVLLALIGYAAGVVAVACRRCALVEARAVCGRCAYSLDLRGMQRCPECGEEVPG